MSTILPKTAIAYYRVSTNQQEISGLGLEAQKEIVTNFCKKEGFNLTHEFSETESGINPNRKILAQALELTKKTNSVLIVAKIDRLTRKLSHQLAIEDSGIRVIAVDQPYIAPAISHMYGVMAEEERRLISIRTKEALAAKKARGEHVGRPKGSLCKDRAAVAANLRKILHGRHLERLNDQPNLITLLTDNYHLYTNAITKKVQEAGFTNKQGIPPSSTTVAKWIIDLKIKEIVDYKLAHPSPTLVLTKTNYTIEEMKKLIAEQEKNN